MRKIKVLIFVFLLFSLLQFATAATIKGNIYDLSLSKLKGAEVSINSVPEQFLISIDGTYSFEIPSGEYKLKAQIKEDGRISSETKNIRINKEGSYIIDLILFPDFSEEDDIVNIPDISVPELSKRNLIPLYLVIIFVIIMIVKFIYFYFKIKPKKAIGIDNEIKEENRSDLENLIQIIKRYGGRTTQKEIRKEIPLSEAKISLMISELEHKGKLKKIKKGRGNIIILSEKE